MVWIDAAPMRTSLSACAGSRIVAAVVDLKPIGNRSHKKLIRGAMRQMRYAQSPDVSIAGLPRNESLEYPATARRNRNIFANAGLVQRSRYWHNEDSFLRKLSIVGYRTGARRRNSCR